MIKSKRKGIGSGARLLLLLGVIVSLIVGYLTYDYLSGERTPVYLYKGDYEEGTPIKGDMFVKAEMATELYNAMDGTGNSYATADMISEAIKTGDCLIMKVAALTPVMENQFVTSGGTEVESRLGKNMVAVELPADKVGGLTSGLRIGSRLNIMTGYTIDSVRKTDLVFQNLLVVDIVKDGEEGIRSVYVEVEPAEAVILEHGVNFETVTAAIVKPGAYIEVDERDASFWKNYSADAVPAVMGAQVPQGGTEVQPAAANENSQGGVTLGEGVQR